MTWHASVQPSRAEVGPVATGNTATRTRVCSVNPPCEEAASAEIAERPTQLSEGSTAWEHNGTLQRGTLQRELRPSQQKVVPGSVGRISQESPTASQAAGGSKSETSYNMESGVELGIARAAQWWHPGTPLQ